MTDYQLDVLLIETQEKLWALEAEIYRNLEDIQNDTIHK